MSLGTSIFLSAVLLGIIILFISTKDRWNWKKIILWPVLVLASLSILSAAGYYVYTLVSNHPKPQTTFWGIPLDSTKGDIKFLKGNPDKDSDENMWFYLTDEERSTYFIMFKDNKVRLIGLNGRFYLGDSFQGIYIGTSYDEIINKFGQPSFVSISENELERTLSYDKYNVFFQFRESRVVGYGIYNNTFGPLKYKKEKKTDLNK